MGELVNPPCHTVPHDSTSVSNPSPAAPPSLPPSLSHSLFILSVLIKFDNLGFSFQIHSDYLSILIPFPPLALPPSPVSSLSPSLPSEEAYQRQNKQRHCVW